MLSLPKITATLFILLYTTIYCSGLLAQEYDQTESVSPLRLSYVEGEVSFWRQGASDWVEAPLNTPLAAGDALYVGKDGDFELQMGSRAFIRADSDTQLNLVNQTPDFIQFKVASGRASFDLRLLPSGYSVEVDTPNAVFNIEHAGYYRVDVDGDVHFITRRGGLATMVPAGGNAMSIHPSEEIVVLGSTPAQAETYVAPELNRWDKWNYDRTESLLDTISDRYLPYGVAGASDLDHYGNWRSVPEYGSVWVPESVPSGWVPYSNGRWSWDPNYQWTWIDDAPWGWAPFHYGRWVYLSGYWAWAPGPVIRHPVYSPALVAFFTVSSGSPSGMTSSGVGWVALSWGEPVKPWWGEPGFVGRPWWGGWGGPRVINNVVVRNTTNINVTNITYNNIHVENAMVATTHEHFGNGHVHDAPVHVSRPQEMEHVHGMLPVKPGPASLVAGGIVGIRPPESMISRPVVGTRPPLVSKLPWVDKTPKPETKAITEQRILPIPKLPSGSMSRPELGNQTGEERLRPNIPPRFVERRQATELATPANVTRGRTETDQNTPKVSHTPAPLASPQGIVRENTPAHVTQEPGRSMPEPRKVEQAPIAPRATPAETRQQELAKLPGKPANRVYQLKNKEKDEQQKAAPKKAE